MCIRDSRLPAGPRESAGGGATGSLGPVASSSSVQVPTMRPAAATLSTDSAVVHPTTQLNGADDNSLVSLAAVALPG